MQKRDLRQRMRALLESVSAAAWPARSAAAVQLLAVQPEFARADVVMIYLSTAQEVDTGHVALEAWGRSKRVLAPRVGWEDRKLTPVEIRSLTRDVAEGQMGIREPTTGAPVAVAEIDMVIVPGLAFDGRGNRLGRGRGFYDRFLTHRDFRAVVCALALEEQFVAAVPADAHDVRVHMLVTDAAVRRFSVDSAG